MSQKQGFNEYHYLQDTVDARQQVADSKAIKLARELLFHYETSSSERNFVIAVVAAGFIDEFNTTYSYPFHSKEVVFLADFAIYLRNVIEGYEPAIRE